MATTILLIGKPHSGKTTFIGQLYARVDANKSLMKLYKPVENLTPIIEATKALANGDEVRPTSTEKSIIITLPLEVDGVMIDLDCPDYGGEQVNLIVENREVDSVWANSIKQSENWILFIKLSDLTTFYDLSNKTIKPQVLENGKGNAEEYSISDQSFFIELLQILLHTKGQDSHFRNSTTKLTIVLTCWDEFVTEATPKEELKKCLPLLLNFIETNWIESKVTVLGLSSQGGSLKENELKIKYQEFGSENFGYVINVDGKKNTDLTHLILEAIK